ncbi:hypothetical protein BXZ70DRAFT_1006034 [Cristinia sonorae]|uniref:Uncharacterized protein n=1 Tax=Cristinia sonorae TaxID=1940300 RepID=A0A8K0USE1_9AGAR|nr:hypothetical protein BXZ70DRAFT_1006034 [Cristinia sonorae]
MELTPAGLAFAIIVFLAMMFGVAAAIWHSWLAPYFLRRKFLAARNDPEKANIEKGITADDSPELDCKDIGTPQNSSTTGDPDESSVFSIDGDTLKGSITKFGGVVDDVGVLARPKPTYCYDSRKIRVAANAPERDLPWWFF